jgi:hypothetical protein
MQNIESRTIRCYRAIIISKKCPTMKPDFCIQFFKRTFNLFRQIRRSSNLFFSENGDEWLGVTHRRNGGGDKLTTNDVPCLMLCDGISYRCLFVAIFFFLVLGFLVTVYGHVSSRRVLEMKERPVEQKESAKADGVKSSQVQSPEVTSFQRLFQPGAETEGIKH